MNYYLIIATGGAFGAVSRYALSGFAEKYNTTAFPVGTFLVNLIGSLLIGIVAILLLEKFPLDQHLRPLVIVGFLGAFTTFSTFSLEVVLLLQQGNYTTAGSYLAMSVVTCVLATWAGMQLARTFV
ncbi:MAG: fluoride efflux transporter CrcB [Pseudohongiellaceae bacterium]